MNPERSLVAAQLFLWRDRFRSQAPIFPSVRIDELDPAWSRAILRVNSLAGRAAQRDFLDLLTGADRQELGRLELERLAVEATAVAAKVPYAWIEEARELGSVGVRLSPADRLRAPWMDHRIRLARSIGADATRLTVMASAYIVRAYRTAAAPSPDMAEASSADVEQLWRNMEAIRARVAHTADAIGADSDERRQLWQVPSQRWRTVVASHLRADTAGLQARWSVYTDPYIAAEVDRSAKHIPLYAELVSPTRSATKAVGAGPSPPERSVWLAAAARALKADRDASAAEAKAAGYDLVLDAVERAESDWGPQPDTSTDDPGWFPPRDAGPEPDAWEW